MPEEKPSAFKQIFVGVAVTVLSAALLVFFGLQHSDKDGASTRGQQAIPEPSVSDGSPSQPSSKEWHLVGTWEADVIEDGMAVRIIWHARPDGTCTYVFQGPSSYSVAGSWRYSDGTLYETFPDGGHGQAAIKWLNDNEFELTVLDVGVPAALGRVRRYHRL